MYPPSKRTMLTIIAAMAARRYVVRADEKLTPFLELRIRDCLDIRNGDSNVTGGAAELQRKATAIVNIQRVIAPVHVTFVVAVWRAKRQNPRT